MFTRTEISALRTAVAFITAGEWSESGLSQAQYDAIHGALRKVEAVNARERKVRAALEAAMCYLNGDAAYEQQERRIGPARTTIRKIDSVLRQ